VGETTGSAWIGAFRDADVDCRVACRDAVWGSRGACHDAVVGDIVDETTGLCRGKAFRDAGLGGIVDVATDPMCHDAILGCEIAFCDTDVGGTAGVTAGP